MGLMEHTGQLLMRFRSCVGIFIYLFFLFWMPKKGHVTCGLQVQS